MQRRSLLQLGAASAALLAITGGSLALLQPGLREHQLTAAGRSVFEGVGRAILDGVLPREPQPQRQALAGLLQRVNALVAGLPNHAQEELSQLLALLHSAAGRRAVAGLATPWDDASIPDMQRALHDMRFSSLALRRQAYQALHDITGSAYFAEAGTWRALGYPGPITV
jgi:hypothetical protein